MYEFFVNFFQQSKSNYATALTDIRRVQERGRQASGLMPAPLDRLLSHLCEQLEHYIEARKDMMDLYPFYISTFIITYSKQH